MFCHKDSFYGPGTCIVGAPTPTPPPMTNPPTVCECTDPSVIPDECEVDILIDLMDFEVSSAHKLLAQWTRAAFHDAGTFNQITGEGGANGCLLTDPLMRDEPENDFLDDALNTLQDIKNLWHAHADTCINVSSADMLQFAIFFAVNRQKGTPGLDAAKRATMISDFTWGRPDEPNCDTMWTLNLPDFNHPATNGPIPTRCTAAGGEIKNKMMDRNGFTDEEATALIGAHTIGLIRNTFGPGMAGAWVTNGEDSATFNGPVFDNAYHDFLSNTIVENTAPAFAGNVAPFTPGPFVGVFPNWFRDVPNDLDHLDTDVALAFPSLDLSIHPRFDTFTNNFAASNTLFLTTFFAALEKMSSLGVSVVLSPPTPCESPCGGGGSGGIGGGGGITVDVAIKMAKLLGNATAFADEATSAIQERRAEEIKKLTSPPADIISDEITTTKPTRPAETVPTKLDPRLVEQQKLEESKTP
eukprot:g14591.t1.1.5e17418c g14591  g14591.t1 contig9:2220923-2222631(+)